MNECAIEGKTIKFCSSSAQTLDEVTFCFHFAAFHLGLSQLWDAN